LGNSVGVIGTEIGGALSAAAGGHHSLFFAGQPLKEMFKLAPFVRPTSARTALPPICFGLIDRSNQGDSRNLRRADTPRAIRLSALSASV
jgi:hypothetical protein